MSCDSLVVAFSRSMRSIFASAQDIFIGGEVVGGFGEDAVPLEAGELDRCCCCDAPSNVLLHAKDVLDLGVVGLGPNVPPRCGLAQLGIDANTVASAANAAINQIARVEQAADLGGRQVPALELKARRLGDDEQVREAAERGNDVLSDAVAEVILARVAGQILKGQYRHGRAPGEMSRGGKARDFDRLRCNAEPQHFAARSRVQRPRSKAGRCERSGRCRDHEGSPPSPWAKSRGPNTNRVGANRLSDILDAWRPSER